MGVHKDMHTPDEGTWVCGVCGQHCSIDKINYMDGMDYQYWGTGMVCDDCLNSTEE